MHLSVNNRHILILTVSRVVSRCSLSPNVRLHCYRFPTDVRVYVDNGSEFNPVCCRAATDHQRLDSDAEEGHWRCGVVQPGLDRVPRRVWVIDQRQLLAGT